MMCFGLELSIDWEVVTAIGTILMALASFIGIVLSYKSIKLNNKVWNEENRPRVIFTIVISDKIYYLKVENIGNKVAYDIKFKVNDNFISKFPDPVLKGKFIRLCNKNIHLTPGQFRHYAISTIEGVRLGNNTSVCNMDTLIIELINEPIVINGFYNNKYCISESFTMNEYTGTYVVSDPLLTKLDKINNSLSEIDNSLKKNIRG